MTGRNAMTCPVCPPERARLPRRPRTCDACRDRLAAQLTEIPELVEELKLRELVVDDAPNRAGRDPVADDLPAASIASRRGVRVTGTKEKPAPLNLDVVDLTSRARAGTVHDRFGDQVGYQSAATVLDTWMREARDHLAVRGQGLPDPTVLALAGWLSVRLDDLMDSFPAIGEMAAEIRVLRAVLRAQLGLVGYDDELKDGVVCPKCDHRAALHQANGSAHIECGVCGVLLTVDEYNRWAGLLAANLTWLRGQTCPSCGLNRLYKFQDNEDIHCGWCGPTEEITNGTDA